MGTASPKMTRNCHLARWSGVLIPMLLVACGGSMRRPGDEVSGVPPIFLPPSDPFTPLDGGPGSPIVPPLVTPPQVPPDAGAPTPTPPGTDANAPDGAPVVSPGGVVAARNEFFRSDVVHKIEMIVDAGAWENYLREHRNFGGNDRTWYGAHVSIDGVQLLDVGFHSFGWGSRLENADKPNIHLDTNRTRPGQTFRGISRMRIKNNGQDVTGIRQTVIYQALREAKLMAPRSTFAELTVNGQPYGFYFVEESFNRDFVQERTGNSNGQAYEPLDCQGLLAPSGGCSQIVDYFEPVFNDAISLGQDLIPLCQAANSPDDQFLGAMASVIDVTEWMETLAIGTTLAGDDDGFTTAGSNFRLYHDTATGKFRLTLLGVDDTFLAERLPQPSFPLPRPTDSCQDDNPDYRDIFLEKLLATPAGRIMYASAVRKMRTGVLEPTRLKQRVDALWSMIGGRVKADPKLNRDYDPDESVDSLKEYIDERWRALEAAGY
jgi:hypothetical protein